MDEVNQRKNVFNQLHVLFKDYKEIILREKTNNVLFEKKENMVLETNNGK